MTIIPNHISASGLKNYLTCPKKYKYAHIDRLRLIVQKPFYAFGRAVHKGIELKIKQNRPAHLGFKEYWGYEKAVGLLYGDNESHEILMSKGIELLKTWENNDTTKELLNTDNISVEKAISKDVEGVPLYGIVDFISDKSVLDWKTSQRAYTECKLLDLQLPFYALLIGDDTRVYGYGVLIKNKTPKIQYLFLKKIRVNTVKEIICRVWDGICKGIFTETPTSSCELCEYLPLCLEQEGAENMFMTDKSND